MRKSRYTQRVVAFGGGHGLAANLRALRHLSDHLTAVVTVADNGGSSGRLRAHLPVLPPGDLRMALAALCDDTQQGLLWRDVIQHRFEDAGELSGHAVGNLLIVALWQLLDDPIAGLDKVAELLGARGRVLPMALEPLDIEAVMRQDQKRVTVRGQAQVASAAGVVERVRLIPESPKVPAEVLTAIAEADWLIFGPGSWFTSVLVHLHVPELADALAKSRARKCITLNLTSGVSEAEGLNNVDLLATLLDLAPAVHFDAVIADPQVLHSVSGTEEQEFVDFARSRGVIPVLRPVAERPGVPVHDPLRLAAAYRDVFDIEDFGREL